MTKTQEKMKAMVLDKLAPIETRPLKLKTLYSAVEQVEKQLRHELKTRGI